MVEESLLVNGRFARKALHQHAISAVQFLAGLMHVGREGGVESGLRLPLLKRDYVTCLAQNPKDERVLAFATRRRDVYLTSDGGGSWRLIAEGAEPRGSTATEGARDR